MVNIAIIGTGRMARVHASNFQKIKGCRLVACCDIAPGQAAEFAQTHGIPAAYEDLAEMLKAEKLDAVSVVTPDSAHCGPVLQCIADGLHVMCEKPLADNIADAKRMAAAAKRKGTITAVNFSYRNSPATQKAAALVADGRLGRILHVEGHYFQSWLSSTTLGGDYRKMPSRLWRLSTRHGSMGCLGDIGVHLYDLAYFVVGPLTEIDCQLATFDKGVKGIDEYVFDANDGFASRVRFKGGAIGALHSSRWATGHSNNVAIRVYGDKGALDLDLDRPEGEKLLGCFGRDTHKPAWKPVRCPKVPSMYQRFITAIRTGKQGQTSFEGAAAVQNYLDASVRSDKARKPIRFR